MTEEQYLRARINLARDRAERHRDDPDRALHHVLWALNEASLDDLEIPGLDEPPKGPSRAAAWRGRIALWIVVVLMVYGLTMIAVG